MRCVSFSCLVLSLMVWGAAAGHTQINPAGLKVEGPLSRADVLKVIVAHAGQIRACIDARQRRDPTVAGKLAMAWSISTAGAVSSVHRAAALSTTDDAALVACLASRIKTWKFPAAEETSAVTEVFVVTRARKGEEKHAPSKRKSLADADEMFEAAPGAALGGRSSSGARGRRYGSSRVGGGGGGGSARLRPSRTVPKSAPARPTVRADRGSARRPAEPADVVRAPRAVAAPAMKAGRHDDNKQFNRFLKFLKDNRHLVEYGVGIDERLVIRLLDEKEKSLHNCSVEIAAAGKTLAKGVSYADGSTQFFPSDKAARAAETFVVKATCAGKERVVEIQRDGVRVNDVRFDFGRTVPRQVPVDIAIVLDTTGSMQSQIDRLKKTLRAIHLQLTQLKIAPDLRFALVAYRDQGDDYVTRVTAFTNNVDKFQRELNKLEADGGGDTPEDLQTALKDALRKLKWRNDAIRMGFVVADAIPHTDYGQKYTYVSAMRESLERGIKWCTVGAGGLPRKGEVIFRQIAQYSMGEYVFVTQGDRGNSDGGVGEASHHVGTNYRVENLDQAIVRIVRRELSYLTDEPTDFDYTIVASGTKATPRDKVLAPAVQEAVRQLTDYCAIRLEPKTPVAILPVETKDKAYNDVAEYLTEQMILTASRKPDFKVVERDLRAIAQEMKMQFSDLFDVEQTVKFGKLTGAELLVVARLTVRGDDAELYGKLVRVETGEILSAAKVHFKGGVVSGS